MSETTPARLLGMSGSLRSGSYSNAVLETLREKFEGHADLKIYDLQSIPPYNKTSKAKNAPRRSRRCSPLLPTVTGSCSARPNSTTAFRAS